MPILIHKHCRILPEPEDGTRLLTMRYWPRGVPKDRFDTWFRELAPSASLLKRTRDESDRTKSMNIENDQQRNFWVQDYIDEMAEQRPLIHDIRRQHDAGKTFTLLCACHNSDSCHRSVLKDLIENPKF